MKITLKMIAEEAGVSQMTVSRILNGKAEGQVSDEVRSRVRRIVEERGYNPGRKFRASSIRTASDQLRQITFLVAYNDLLKKQKRGSVYTIHRLLSQSASEKQMKIDTLPYLMNNQFIDWEKLNMLHSGNNVLTAGVDPIAALTGLQRNGCRVGVIMKDLYWREYYAPQLKSMYSFIIKTADAISRSTKLLLDSGCQWVACVMRKEFMHEPNYPIMLGYQHALSLCGSRCFYPVVIDGQRKDWLQQLRKAYEERPFDGLIYHETFSRTRVPDGDLHHFLQLPDSVRLIITQPLEDPCVDDATAQILYPYQKIAQDAVSIMARKNFTPGEQFYDCEITVNREQ